LYHVLNSVRHFGEKEMKRENGGIGEEEAGERERERERERSSSC
jgi:hypothetical protein